MIVFPDSKFFLFIPIYLLAIIFAFFIPGDFFVKRLKLDFISRITLSFIFGICLWALQGLVSGYLNLRNLNYAYISIFFIIWIATLKNFTNEKIKIDAPAMLISILGGLTCFSAIWLMGIRIGKSLLFCCRSVPDAIYHLSLTNEIVERFPPFEPGSTGIIVQNYHYLANLVMADLARVFHLPLIPTVYQYSPILLIVLLCMAISTFCKLISSPKIYKYLLLFFVFFSGDVNFLLIFLTTGKINFAFDVFDNASRLLTSPPRAFSIIIFFGTLCFITIWIKKKSVLAGISVAFLTALLIGFKIHTFVPVFTGLSAILFYRFFALKDKMAVVIFLIAGIVALIVYLPVNSGAGGLVFTGFWRLSDYIVKPSLHLANIEFARQAYMATGNWTRVIGFDLFLLFSYLIFNLGTTFILSLFVIKKVRNVFPREIFIFLLTSQVVLIVLGIFFIQNTGGANTVQFLITYEPIGAIIAAGTVCFLIKALSRRVVYLFIIAVIFLTSARVLNEFTENTLMYKTREKIIISEDEINAFNYLSEKTSKNSVVAIAPPFATQNISVMIPLFSKRGVFLAGTSDHGVLGLEKRILDNKQIFQGLSDLGFEKLIKENSISYLYVPKSGSFNLKKYSDNLKKVFENKSISIFRAD